MKITFLGAAHEVTGSCTLVECGGVRFIVDCGMEQGRDMFVNQRLPVSPGEVDFALLTHAHIDHSGLLPLLVKNGFSGAVYATAATCSLADIMLRDSAHIQMSEAEYKTRKAQRAGRPAVEPLYDLGDVEALVKLLRPCAYGEAVQPAEGVAVRFTDIGHLLGSACIEIWLSEGGVTKKLVFSGDIGNTRQPILRDPQRIASADYVVVESTYGDRTHGAERPDYISLLAGAIQRTLDRGGNVVIPAFAVGRTQEMLYFIREIKERGLVRGHDGFKAYVDSPLAIEATSVFLQCDTSFLDDEARAILARGVNPLYFDGLETSVSAEESKAINADTEPKVIISASGMCDAGRIRHHLKHNLWRSESLILFVGYQAEGTLGRALYEGAKEVRLFGEDDRRPGRGLLRCPACAGTRTKTACWTGCSASPGAARRRCSSTTGTTRPARPSPKALKEHGFDGHGALQRDGIRPRRRGVRHASRRACRVKPRGGRRSAPNP